ncbi:hypothetical protein BHE74_00016058, partial [Ensete ventricosum]
FQDAKLFNSAVIFEVFYIASFLAAITCILNKPHKDEREMVRQSSDQGILQLERTCESSIRRAAARISTPLHSTSRKSFPGFGIAREILRGQGSRTGNSGDRRPKNKLSHSNTTEKDNKCNPRTWSPVQLSRPERGSERLARWKPRKKV